MAEHREVPSVTVPNASGVVLFAIMLVMLVAGFWVMGLGVDLGNGLVFSGGLLLSGGGMALALRGGA